MKQIYRKGIFLLLLAPVLSWSAIDTYEFETTEQQERFQALTDELRCPKCQNQNIADSNSEIAKDLRGEIHRLLGEGSSNEQIVDFMVERYGDFVLYKPPVKKVTYPLWYGPFILIFLGGMIVFWIGRRSRRQRGNVSDEAARHLSSAEQQRLDSLLQQNQDGNRQ